MGVGGWERTLWDGGVGFEFSGRIRSGGLVMFGLVERDVEE